jgi:hypothetical protein
MQFLAVKPDKQVKRAAPGGSGYNLRPLFTRSSEMNTLFLLIMLLKVVKEK